MLLACFFFAIPACLDFGFSGWKIGPEEEEEPDGCDGDLYAAPIGWTGSTVRLAPNAPLTVDGRISLSGSVVPDDLASVTPAGTHVNAWWEPKEQGLQIVGLRVGTGELRVTDGCGRKGKYRFEVVEPAETSVTVSYSESLASPLQPAPESLWLAPDAGWVIGATSHAADGGEILHDTVVEGDPTRFRASYFSDADRRVVVEGAGATGPLDLLVNGIPLALGVQELGEGIELAAVDPNGVLVESLDAEVGVPLTFGVVGRDAEGRLFPLGDRSSVRAASSEPTDGAEASGLCFGVLYPTDNRLCHFEFASPGSRMLTLSRDDLTGTVEVHVR